MQIILSKWHKTRRSWWYTIQMCYHPEGPQGMKKCLSDQWPCEKPFPNVQPELSLRQLHSVCSCPITNHQRGEISSLPSAHTLEETVDCHELISQPSLLQAELQKWLQPHLVSLALKIFHRLVSLLWTHSCNFIGFLHWSSWNCAE